MVVYWCLERIFERFYIDRSWQRRALGGKESTMGFYTKKMTHYFSSFYHYLNKRFYNY